MKYWNRFDAVIHFAGLKAVAESVAKPRRYFDFNLVGTINLYEFMAKYNCKKVRTWPTFLSRPNFLTILSQIIIMVNLILTSMVI